MGSGLTRAVTWAVALVTASVVVRTLSDPAAFTWAEPRANLVIQTTAALVALLVAVIAYGRFSQRRRSADLLLVLGLGQLAAANLFFTAFPLAGDLPGVPSRTIWAATLVRLGGSVLLAGAAFAHGRVLDVAHHRYVDVSAVAIVAALLTGVAYAAAGRLPRVGPAVLDPMLRLWDTEPGLAALTFLVAVASAVAAAGFARGLSREPGDELLGWLSVALVISAGASVVTVGSFQSTYSEYLSGAEVLKLGCYLVLLGGVVREILGYWHDRATIAVADERRRIAREMHDGLAQELAFVVTRMRVLARRRPDDDDLSLVGSAAERALDESRRAIAALSRDHDEPLDVALAQTAEEVAGRLGTEVTLELDGTVDVSDDTKEALLRIAREAITNAARHGDASRINVRLFHDGGLRLRISDNGRGFDAERLPDNPGRLGITSMRERAAALGGELRVSSRRPGGTEVEVLLP